MIDIFVYKLFPNNYSCCTLNSSALYNLLPTTYILNNWSGVECSFRCPSPFLDKNVLLYSLLLIILHIQYFMSLSLALGFCFLPPPSTRLKFKYMYIFLKYVNKNSKQALLVGFAWLILNKI